MTSDIWEPKPPKLPKPSHVMAVFIETCIVATFIYHHSIAGVFLCVTYFWFSATYALFRLNDND